MPAALRVSLAYRRYAGWCWLIGLAILPLIFDMRRVEAFETPRSAITGALAIGIGLAALITARATPRASLHHYLSQPLVLAVVVWSTAAAISAVLSLSPARSLFGDTQRRMGFVTQFSLLAAFVGGMILTRRQRGLCWLIPAFTGLIVASFGISQRAGLLPFLPGQGAGQRSASLFGTATFAAGWTAMTILWLVAALCRPGRRSRMQTIFLSMSLLALALFLILTEARGAALGLVLGILTLASCWSLTHKQRRLGLTLLVASVPILALWASLYLGALNVRGTPFSGIPLLGRMSAAADQQTGRFRLLLWRDAVQIVDSWPAMTAVDGRSDPLAAVRPVIGYGQEMFEFAEHQYLSQDLLSTLQPGETRIDRAHNLWLDTLIGQGYIGLISLLAVYLAAAWTCARILRQQGAAWGEKGWIAAAALAILVCRGADLQFSFPVVSGEWMFWAILGLLSGTALQQPTRQPGSDPAPWGQLAPIVVLSCWVLLWSVGTSPTTLQLRASGWLPIAGTAVAGVSMLLLRARRIPARYLAFSAIALTLWSVLQLGAGAVAADKPVEWQSGAMYAVLLTDNALLFWAIGLATFAVGCRLRHGPIHLSSRALVVVCATLLGTVWWILDATADAVFRVARDYPPEVQAVVYRSALTLKTPDDRLLGIGGEAALSAVYTAPADRQEAWLTAGGELIDQALAVNPYNTDLVLQRANYLIGAALRTSDMREQARLLDGADQLYSTATRQWPTNPDILLEHARFVLAFERQPVRAIGLVRQAVRLRQKLP